MYIIEDAQRIMDMHSLIKSKTTGTPDDFAARLYLSRRQLYRMIEEIEKLGAEISYNKVLKSFYYRKKFDLYINIKINEKDCLPNGHG